MKIKPFFTIGIDLDNTIICYDRTVYNTAISLNLIPKSHKISKRTIRDTVRKLELGDIRWQEIQRTVYGERMGDAHIFDGAVDFIREALRNGHTVYVVSHKTSSGNYSGKRLNLIENALGFLVNNGIIELLGRKNIYFEPTRERKIERIRMLGCDYFIDDLEEVLTDEEFPAETKKILFDPHGINRKIKELKILGSWNDIRRYFVNQESAIPSLRAGNKKEYIRKIINNAGNLLGEEICLIEEMKKSGNSRSYMIKTPTERFFLKMYSGKTADGKDRSENEFEAVKFLKEKGIRNIPEPILLDKKEGVGIYEFIESGRNPGSGIHCSDADEAISFIRDLKDISEKHGNEWKGRASEACFSLKELFENLESRFAKLEKVENNDLKNVLDEIRGILKAGYRMQNPDLNKILPQKFRILSPSDFGFHNAIRTDNGNLIFVDFEHFGWDDPVKLISDFLIHPKMRLKKSLRKLFLEKSLEIFKADGDIKERFEIMFPLFQLKWALILLNEFLPEHYKRREFAVGKPLDRERVLRRQLEKAYKLLNKVKLGNLF